MKMSEELLQQYTLRREVEHSVVELPLNLLAPAVVEIICSYYDCNTLAGNRHTIEDSQKGFLVPHHPIEGFGI